MPEEPHLLWLLVEIRLCGYVAVDRQRASQRSARTRIAPVCERFASGWNCSEHHNGTRTVLGRAGATAIYATDIASDGTGIAATDR